MPTMTKSKRFQPLRKKASRCATIFAPSSSTKIDRQIRSSVTISPPAAAMALSDVSSPRSTALKRITAVMTLRVTARSRKAARRSRKVMDERRSR